MAYPRTVRDLVLRAVGGQPSVHVGRRATDRGIDEGVVRGAMELALRIGEAMLSLGASAADVTGAILGTTRTFGLDGCQVDVTFTSITVSYDRGGSSVPVTLMRVVLERADDYGRLGRVVVLAREVQQATVEPDDARTALEEYHDRLDYIVTAPHPYNRWVVTTVLSTMAAGVAVLLGGGLAVALVAGLTTTMIDLVTWRLRRWGLPAFFRQAVGAAIAASVAVALFVVVPYLPFDLATLPPSLVVASGIVVLLAGLGLVGSAEDAISGFPVTAGGRAFEVVVLTVGIIAGIGGVLDIARRAGVQLEVIDISTGDSPLVVQLLAAATIAAAWGTASYARPRTVAIVAAAGTVAWLVFALVSSAGIGPAVASAVAALVIGFLAESVGPRLQVPPIVFSVCGIIPLLPGLAIYRGLFQMVNEPSVNGVGLAPGVAGLVGAGMIGLGIASGVTLGEFLAAPVRRAVARSGRRTAVLR